MATAGSDSRFDVVVVGAGPGGSAAAQALARAGRRVLVVERAQFPRPKVCGGCLSGLGLACLRLLLGRENELPGRASTGVTFVVGRLRLTCDPGGATWMAPRDELDSVLAQAAQGTGAEYRFGQPGTLELEHNRWTVVVAGERIQADLVLLASGLGGPLHKIGIAGRRVGAPMIAQQWIQPNETPLPQPGEVELHWLRGGYVGLATPKAGQCVVALATRTSILRGASAFDRLRELNPEASIMQALPADAPRRFDAHGTAGFPWSPARLGDRNLLLIGDAAGYAEPYSGEGIGQALRSGICAASAVAQGGDVVRNYEQLMSPSRRVFRRVRFVSGLLQWPGVHALARHWPFVPQRLLTGVVRHMHVGRKRGESFERGVRRALVMEAGSR